MRRKPNSVKGSRRWLKLSPNARLKAITSRDRFGRFLKQKGVPYDEAQRF